MDKNCSVACKSTLIGTSSVLCHGDPTQQVKKTIEKKPELKNNLY
jgi:hypothetical protein